MGRCPLHRCNANPHAGAVGPRLSLEKQSAICAHKTNSTPWYFFLPVTFCHLYNALVPLRSKTAAHDGIKDWAVVHCNAAEPREASSASEERKHVYLLLLVFAGGSGGRCELVLQIFFFSSSLRGNMHS